MAAQQDIVPFSFRDVFGPSFLVVISSTEMSYEMEQHTAGFRPANSHYTITVIIQDVSYGTLQFISAFIVDVPQSADSLHR